MRIVYDDTAQPMLIRAIDLFLNRLDIRSLVEYDYGMERVQMHKLRERLNAFLQYNYCMEIGKKVTHAHDIGNNCCYPVYYHPEGDKEIQQCASINLNSGMYSSGYLNLEDYNGKRVGSAYEISTHGIKKKP